MSINQNNSVSPIYGVPRQMRTSDFPKGYSAPSAALTAVNTNTTSSAISLGARSVMLEAEFTDATTSCDILLYYVDPSSGDTLAYTFTGVSQANNDSLFAGNQEGVNLNGYPVKVRAQNFSGAGKVTINIQATA